MINALVWLTLEAEADEVAVSPYLSWAAPNFRNAIIAHALLLSQAGMHPRTPLRGEVRDLFVKRLHQAALPD